MYATFVRDGVFRLVFSRLCYLQIFGFICTVKVETYNIITYELWLSILS